LAAGDLIAEYSSIPFRPANHLGLVVIEERRPVVVAQ
jgi:hypothetical protein